MWAFFCWWLPLCRYRECHCLALTQGIPRYYQLSPLKPILTNVGSTWLVIFTELWLPLCQDCVKTVSFLAVMDCNAGCWKHPLRRPLRSEEMIALMPKHLTMNHKAGSTYEERALMPIGQRRSRTLDCGQLVRNAVLNVPTKGNWKVQFSNAVIRLDNGVTAFYAKAVTAT